MSISSHLLNNNLEVLDGTCKSEKSFLRDPRINDKNLIVGPQETILSNYRAMLLKQFRLPLELILSENVMSIYTSKVYAKII